MSFLKTTALKFRNYSTYFDEIQVKNFESTLKKLKIHAPNLTTAELYFLDHAKKIEILSLYDVHEAIKQQMELIDRVVEILQKTVSKIVITKLSLRIRQPFPKRSFTFDAFLNSKEDLKSPIFVQNNFKVQFQLQYSHHYETIDCYWKKCASNVVDFQLEKNNLVWLNG